MFFSISQTPDAAGTFPDETTMYSNYLEQLQVADELGYGVAWLAQAHLSTEVQKQNRNPVIPHWQGEVGLCTDFFQLALLSMEKTNQIEIGSAVLSILAMVAQSLSPKGLGTSAPCKRYVEIHAN